MAQRFKVLDKHFYPGNVDESKSAELSDEIIIQYYHFNKLINEFDENETLYVNLTNVDTHASYLVTIGSPHHLDADLVYIPHWIMDCLELSDDSKVTIEKATINNIPVAEKIVIRPLDPIAFEINTLELFENAFMNLHSIREGLTIPVIVSEISNDYVIYTHIEKVEPANLSRIVNGKIDVDFINEFEIPATATATATYSPLITPLHSETNQDTTQQNKTEYGCLPLPLPDISLPASASSTKNPQTTEEDRAKMREARLRRFMNNPQVNSDHSE
jgi:hypothetical protein